MKTLSDQLTELYESKWDGLMAQLETNGLKDQLQCPFLISLLRSEQKKEEREKEQTLIGYDKWYAQKEIPKHEEWYTKADIKIMFFGKEPNGWERDNVEEHLDVGDLMATYEDFLDDNYVAIEGNGGYFSGGSQFFKRGINGIMAEIKDNLLNAYPGKRVSMIWNEISKLSARTTKGGGAVNADVHEIEKNFFHVIPDEVEILKPDILIFFIGPGMENNKYYNYILENFKLNGKPNPLPNLPTGEDVIKLPIEGVKFAYKTYHPGYAPKDANTFHWKLYDAILKDIKENIDKLLKKE